MNKYFKERQEEKKNLSEYMAITEEQQKVVDAELKSHLTQKSTDLSYYNKARELTEKEKTLALRCRKISFIGKVLGDVEISQSVLDAICKSFDETKCRYGTICLGKDSVSALYEISELFPELSEEALVTISREYIKDLYEEYSLIDVLNMLIRKEGSSDSTFEKFMDIVREKADILDKKYEYESSNISLFYGHYGYDFVIHFTKFMKEHHITWKKFIECVPSPELILKDELQLIEISRTSKDCWGCCTPVSYRMFEDYLDGDCELSEFYEQPTYYVSTNGKKIPTTFTKTDFLKNIKKEQEKIKRKR